jgi:hypothetical protein
MIRLFANEGQPSQELTAPAFFVANESRLRIDDGGEAWVQLSPFGDFANSYQDDKGRMVEIIQRVRPEDGLQLANDFQNPVSRVLNPFGLPWYIGHPDHPAFAMRYTDGRAYGRIKEVVCRNDSNCLRCQTYLDRTAKTPCPDHGVFGRVKFGSKGKQMINEEEFGGHSVNWRLRPEGTNGKLWRPFTLKSCGFSNEPNIPVNPVTAVNEKNAMEIKDDKNTPDPMLAEFAKASGKPELSDPKELVGHITNCMTRLNELESAKKDADKDTEDRFAKLMKEKRKKDMEAAKVANEKAGNILVLDDEDFGTVELANAAITVVTTLRSDLTKITGERDQLSNEKTKLAQQFVNERRSLVKATLDRAITLGLLTGAQRTNLEKSLKDDQFANEASFTDLFSNVQTLLKPTVKVLSETGNLKQRHAEATALDQSTRSQLAINLVNERIAKNKAANLAHDYDSCFFQVMTEQPELFGAVPKV